MQPSVLEYLLGIAVSSLSGSMVVTGSSSAVTFPMKKTMLEKWGDIDTGADGLKVTYPVRAIDRALISGEGTLRQLGTYGYDVTPATAGGISTVYGNNFKKIEWAVSSTAYVILGKNAGEVVLNRLGVEMEDGSGPTVDLICRIILLDGSVITATKTLKCYDRSARVGDFVFHDGTYSDENDGSKTCIGACFYSNKETGLRLMVSAQIPTNGNSSHWGLYPDNSSGVQNVQLESGYDVYDTPMVNNTTHGILKTEQGGQDYYISDATYRDESENGVDGFRVPKAGSSADTLGLVTLKEDFHQWKTGDKIPYGLYYTLQLIDHRDRILTELGLDIPAAGGEETEAQNLETLIQKIIAQNGADKYDQFYYPAASRCHAYEPLITRAGDVLADKFKAGNWWLASPGELNRIYWHHSKGYDGAEHAIFTKAYKAGVFAQHYAGSQWTSLEVSRSFAWYVNFGNGYTYLNFKCNACGVRPVAAF